MSRIFGNNSAELFVTVSSFFRDRINRAKRGRWIARERRGKTRTFALMSSIEHVHDVCSVLEDSCGLLRPSPPPPFSLTRGDARLQALALLRPSTPTPSFGRSLRTCRNSPRVILQLARLFFFYFSIAITLKNYQSIKNHKIFFQPRLFRKFVWSRHVGIPVRKAAALKCEKK